MLTWFIVLFFIAPVVALLCIFASKLVQTLVYVAGIVGVIIFSAYFLHTIGIG